MNSPSIRKSLLNNNITPNITQVLVSFNCIDITQNAKAFQPNKVTFDY